jgi:hypothetical protein
MKTTFFSRLQNSEELKIWLEQSKENQAYFLKEITEIERSRLDMSIESVEWLGQFLCNRFSNLDAANNETGIQFLDGAGRYVGETFIKHFGGEWAVDLDPILAYCGEPSIENYNYKGIVLPIYPRTWVTATTGRPEPDFIKKRFEYHIKNMRENR